MTFLLLLQTNLATVAGILAAMAVIALLETGIPLHARDTRHRSHLGPTSRSPSSPSAPTC
jgi:hypothetical protein